jgi:hypothetical protein
MRKYIYYYVTVMSVSDKMSLKHTHTGNVFKLPTNMLCTRNELRSFELLKAVLFKIIICLVIFNITNVMGV